MLFQIFWRKRLHHGGADPRVGQRLEQHAAPQLLHHHHAFHWPHVHATVGVLHVQTCQAQLCQCLVHGSRKTAFGNDAPVLVKGIGLVHPFADRVTQLRLFVGKIKVHGVPCVS